MLTFREFLDKPTIARGTTDPNTMARNWERLAPQDPIQNHVNNNEVWRLVKRLSDNDSNRAWKDLVSRYDLKGVPDITVYRNGIDEFFKKKGVVGQVHGEIAFKDPGFHCQPVTRKQAEERGVDLPGKVASFVRIAPPPLVYTNEDRSVLAGVVLHELRHALDFHDMEGTMSSGADYTKDMGTHYEIDVDLYARNILECRAHADQVKNLINTLGGGNKARHALRETALARMLVPALRDSMLELIDLLCGMNENLDPPAIVRTVDRHETERILDILENIIESLRIRRYLK